MLVGDADLKAFTNPEKKKNNSMSRTLRRMKNFKFSKSAHPFSHLQLKYCPDMSVLYN